MEHLQYVQNVNISDNDIFNICSGGYILPMMKMFFFVNVKLTINIHTYVESYIHGYRLANSIENTLYNLYCSQGDCELYKIL